MNGNLYLIPTTLGGENVNDVIPELVFRIINQTRFYIVENVRTARRFLSKAGIETPIDSLEFFELNKHTTPEAYKEYLNPAAEGHHVGIISEAGVPAVADPGAVIVQLAHSKNIRVVPLTGPSSIILALMASGMNGQSFAFNGYLPIKKPDRIKAIKFYEKRSQQENQAQLFIETPYRNMALLEDILVACDDNTKLCIAADLTLASEYIQTMSVKEWKKIKPALHKRPAIFIIQRN